MKSGDSPGGAQEQDAVEPTQVTKVEFDVQRSGKHQSNLVDVQNTSRTPQINLINPIDQGVVVLERGEISCRDMDVEKQAVDYLKE